MQIYGLNNLNAQNIASIYSRAKVSNAFNNAQRDTFPHRQQPNSVRSV